MEWRTYILICAGTIVLIATFNVGYAEGGKIGNIQGKITMIDQIQTNFPSDKTCPAINDTIKRYYADKKEQILSCSGIRDIDVKWVYTWFKNRVPKASCEGIEEYYTGKGFNRDFYDIEKDYLTCYSTYDNDTKGILPISALKECKENYDCEDFSFAVMCLAQLYEIDCEYTSEIKYYEKQDKAVTHIGIMCDSNRDGEYENFN